MIKKNIEKILYNQFPPETECIIKVEFSKIVTESDYEDFNPLQEEFLDSLIKIHTDSRLKNRDELSFDIKDRNSVREFYSEKLEYTSKNLSNNSDVLEAVIEMNLAYENFRYIDKSIIEKIRGGKIKAFFMEYDF